MTIPGVPERPEKSFEEAYWSHRVGSDYLALLSSLRMTHGDERADAFARDYIDVLMEEPPF